MTIDFEALRAPFAGNELEWKPQTITKDGGKALAVPYLTSRAIMNRLDEVVRPENWKDEYSPAPDGGVMCGLSIRVNGEWITKYDAAENTQIEGVKGGISDSLKRAAVKWGIGRYLYDADNVWCEIESYQGQNGKWNFKSWKQQPTLKIDGKPAKPAQKQAQTQPQVQTTTKAIETPVAPNLPAQVAIVANTVKPTREPMSVDTLLSTFADRIEKQHAADDANKALVGDDETRGMNSISAQFKRFLAEACQTTISDKTQVLFYQALFGQSVDSSKKMTLGQWTVLDQWMNSKTNRSVAMQEAAALFDHLMKPTLEKIA